MLGFAFRIGQLATNADRRQVSGENGIVVDVLQIFAGVTCLIHCLSLSLLLRRMTASMVELRHDDLQRIKMSCWPRQTYYALPSRGEGRCGLAALRKRPDG